MVSAAPTAAAAGVDVIIIGDGLIGLSTALAISRAGGSVKIIGRDRPGSASAAAAGLLLPSLEKLPPDARPFFSDSLDRYASWIEALNDPHLTLIPGGAVDNVRLLAATRAAVAALPNVTIASGLVTSIAQLRAAKLVLAAGAWASGIADLPRPLPVRPLKGQMIALGASPLDRAVVGDDIYLVPRGRETIVGSTTHEAGFDTANDDEAIRSLQTAAAALCPQLVDAPVTRAWTGLRPATPDMLPILGPDPAMPNLLYACGHSRNGILLAPGTAVAIAALAAGRASQVPIDPFSITRFM